MKENAPLSINCGVLFTPGSTLALCHIYALHSTCTRYCKPLDKRLTDDVVGVGIELLNAFN